MSLENVPSSIEAIFSDYASGATTLEPAQKRLRASAEDLGWDWLGLASRQSFNRISAALLSAWSYAEYCDMRAAQIRDGGLQYMVFRADIDCRDEHHELDALVLPVDHQFWTSFSPPLGWGCSCYVVGASSARTAGIMGGEVAKQIPAWAEALWTHPKSQACIDPPWRQRPLSLLVLLDALRTGNGPS